MKQVNVKKLLILNLPYLLFVWLFNKAAQAVRLSPGADLSGKLLNLGSGFSQAMESIAPSFHPADLLAGALLLLEQRQGQVLAPVQARRPGLPLVQPPLRPGVPARQGGCLRQR